MPDQPCIAFYRQRCPMYRVDKAGAWCRHSCASSTRRPCSAGSVARLQRSPRSPCKWHTTLLLRIGANVSMVVAVPRLAQPLFQWERVRRRACSCSTSAGTVEERQRAWPSEARSRRNRGGLRPDLPRRRAVAPQPRRRGTSLFGSWHRTEEEGARETNYPTTPHPEALPPPSCGVRRTGAAPRAPGTRTAQGRYGETGSSRGRGCERGSVRLGATLLGGGSFSCKRPPSWQSCELPLHPWGGEPRRQC